MANPLQRHTALAALVAACCLAVAPRADAEARLRWRGSILGDIRFETTDGVPFERLETSGEVRLTARLSKHVAAGGHARLMYLHTQDPKTFDDLTSRSKLDPFRIESDALFVEFIDIGLEGLDLRVGRQQIIWGSADRFHPTSNLNPLDLEDPIGFGQVIANEMVSLRFRPDWSAGDGDVPWFDEFSLELVFVPFFKPAELPSSARAAFTERPEFRPRANTPLLNRLVDQQETLIAAGWTFENIPSTELPERNLRNSMFGGRMGFRLLGADLGFSYFRGFDDLPRAERIFSTVVVTDVTSDIQLRYPRVQVFGFDFATSLEFLGGMGLWAEVGITQHDDLFRAILTGPVVGVNEAEIEYPKGIFTKAVVGLDYSLTPWWYINVQYLRGFPDEFGSDMIEDYIVAGMDFKLGTDTWLIRLFNIVNVDDGSFVLFPQLTATPWTGGEITLGALLYSGDLKKERDVSKKFESLVVGSSTVFLRAKASF
ncbi:MAG: hypothetical protein H6744_07030 [Deltaproteobacteria bacterium]|nr:hypothetical protein [Deltaproteobacteria bacterium]MCB9786432.1 hypothetical protein [Deltaproteobacteria bacterium]